MKKTLAVLIAAILVATALCACLTVSAESTNLALNATVIGAEPTNGNPWTDKYNASLVDGVAVETVDLANAPGDWFAFYYNADYVSNAVWDSELSKAIATFTIDLGAAASVESVRLHMVTDEATTAGAVAPQLLTVEYSSDNATWATLVEKTDFSEYSGVAWVEAQGSEAVDAQYIRFTIGFRGYSLLLNEVQVIGTAGAADEPSEETTGEDPAETSDETTVESSDVTSGEASEETSGDVSDETTVENSDVTSDEASEETSGETSDVTPVPTETKNVAEGKPYTGAEPSTNPSNTRYNAKLTDGAAKDSLTDIAEGDWFAFYYNDGAEGINAPDKIGTFVVDLEAVYSVSAVKINTFVGNMWGIVPPESITIEYSVDGETFAPFAAKSFTTPEKEKDADGNEIEIDRVEFVEFTSDANVDARYIKVTVKLGGIFTFINEVQVLGEVPVEGETSEPETSTSTPEASASEATTSAPTTGDAGLIGFVVLAVIALAGAAVAVKVRH